MDLVPLALLAPAGADVAAFCGETRAQNVALV
jgi:hypothetical protein